VNAPIDRIVIAIDGPAASGKSSVARALARRLGFVYVNTGAMYRAATWLAVSKGVPSGDAERVRELIESADVSCGLAKGESTICLNGIDPSEYLVDEAVNANVSAIASIPEVRRILVEKQRAYALSHDLVMEGRDIGSVVFPETPFKFYVDASPEVRAMRREKQGMPILSRSGTSSIPRVAPVR
jgi:cytidylate kinase